MKKLVLLFSLSITLLVAKTIIVDQNSSHCIEGDFYVNTISDAISNADDGDTINICPGTYNESITINKKDLIIRGVGENIDDVVIDSNGYTIKITSASNYNMVMEHFRLRSRERAYEAAIWADGNTNNKIILKDLIIDSDGKGLMFQNGFSCAKNITIRSRKRGIDIGTPKGPIFIDGFDINSAEADGIWIGSDKNIDVFIRNSMISAKDNGIQIDKASNILIDSVCVSSRKRGIYLPANALNPIVKNSIITSSSTDEPALVLEVNQYGFPRITNNCFYGVHQVKATNRNSYFNGNYFDGVEDIDNNEKISSNDSEKLETQDGDESYIEDYNYRHTCQNRCRIGDIEYTCPYSESYPITETKTGPFDAWDDYNNFRGVFDRNISTKIAGKSFKLTIASMNRYNNGIETKENIDIKFRLYDKSNSEYLDNDWIDFNASAGKDGPSKQYTFTIEEAHKDVVVKFRVCASKDDSLYILYPYNECEVDHDEQDDDDDCNDTDELHSYIDDIHENINDNDDNDNDDDDDDDDDEKEFIEFESSDSFAIRPNSFQVDNPNKIKKYIKAGNFNIIVKAVNEINDTVKDYNASIISLNIQPTLFIPDELNISCPSNGYVKIENKSQKFLNGEINATIKFSETGLFKFKVSEKNGSEWAYVDRDDTNDDIRYIQPSEIKFAFIPYKFETNATYETTNGKDWVYMNTIPKSSIPKMSAYINYTVIAKNEDGNITQNFTNQCFSDESYEYRTTFDLYLNTEINSSSEINISQYDDNNYTNCSLNIGKNSIKSIIKSSQFTNGIGKAKIYFNIDRDKTKAVPPILITLLEVNSSSTSSDYNDINVIGKKDINSSKKFYYGRVYAPNYRLTDNNQTKIFAEIYCGETSSLCPSDYEKSVDNELWRINRDHSLTDGELQLIPIQSEVTINTESDTFQAGAIQPNITYDGSKGYPFSTRIKIVPDSWLIYNQYDQNAKYKSFFIEFYNSTTNGWTGKGYNIGLHVDENSSKVPNKRINW
ncbi:hypothetical protein [Hydrogenimonas thermophila]|uniref:Right handed beta helix region n=1 Tax=Hydrogenimonas thermophila TaxID=223786 RepID=A0A1I5M936_9BACT|nr:hypothetical protein [Hydrogenimonas thermophila]SFP06148.1 hypothetical protein SAMN05216234_10568 [Hydrogenimonas thermophila]